MQKYWKVVRQEGVVSELEAVAVKLRSRHKGLSLRAIAKRMADMGHTNGKGKPYHQEQVDDMLSEGARKLRARFWDKRSECLVRESVRNTLRQKDHYSCKTEADPYLQGRLSWWKLRKVGRKPNTSSYESKIDPTLAKKGWYRGSR